MIAPRGGFSMIIRENKSWIGFFFNFRAGTILDEIWLRLLLAVLFSVGVTAAFHWNREVLPHLTTTPFSIIGVALSIFLGFRNNAAYDRFWEGRKLWGRLVNTSRSLTRALLTLPVADEAERGALRAAQERLVYRLIGYVHALRIHLRDEETHWDAIEPFLDKAECEALKRERNKPNAILHTMSDDLAALEERGWIDRFTRLDLERYITDCTDIQGACERIKTTPIPLSHTALTHRIVGTYLFTLPFGIVDSVGTVTPFVTLLFAYAFFGLDAIGDEMEDPFGTDCNDLPLLRISTTIEQNLRQRLGEEKVVELPPPEPNGTII